MISILLSFCSIMYEIGLFCDVFFFLATSWQLATPGAICPSLSNTWMKNSVTFSTIPALILRIILLGVGRVVCSLLMILQTDRGTCAQLSLTSVEPWISKPILARSTQCMPTTALKHPVFDNSHNLPSIAWHIKGNSLLHFSYCRENRRKQSIILIPTNISKHQSKMLDKQLTTKLSYERGSSQLYPCSQIPNHAI